MSARGGDEAGYVLSGDGRYVSKDGRWFWSGTAWLPTQKPRRRLHPWLKFFLAWPIFWFSSLAIAAAEGIGAGLVQIAIGAPHPYQSIPGATWIAFGGGFLVVVLLWRRF